MESVARDEERVRGGESERERLLHKLVEHFGGLVEARFWYYLLQM